MHFLQNYLPFVEAHQTKALKKKIHEGIGPVEGSLQLCRELVFFTTIVQTGSYSRAALEINSALAEPGPGTRRGASSSACPWHPPEASNFVACLYHTTT